MGFIQKKVNQAKEVAQQALTMAADGIATAAQLSPAQAAEIDQARKNYLKSESAGEQDKLDVVSKCLNAIHAEVTQTYLPLVSSSYWPVTWPDENFSPENRIRFFDITKWTVDSNENNLDKLVNVYQALSEERCAIALIYTRTTAGCTVTMAVENCGELDQPAVANGLSRRFRSAFYGNFPGAELGETQDGIPLALRERLSGCAVAAVSNLPSEKSENFVSQSIEKLLDGVVPQREADEYSIVLLATPADNLRERQNRLCQLYTELSPYATWQKSRGSIDSLSESASASVGASLDTLLSFNLGRSSNRAQTSGITSGSTETYVDYGVKHIQDMLESQIKRMDQCAALGMWDFAAYIFSHNYDMAKNVAHMYLSLTQGEESYLEQAAINVWEPRKAVPIFPWLRALRHPQFALSREVVQKEPEQLIYPSQVSVTTALTGAELAHALNFPRKSVSGLPVYECVPFGREVVQYARDPKKAVVPFGRIYHMRQEEKAPVCLDRDSLTAHVFITGSTGAGKSNAIYTLLNQLCLEGDTDANFLVIEPAKGEYKEALGGYPNVQVYGTNPYKAPLLRLNPFSFPEDTHVLEHIDRLIEIFNACWPMYAAMPAVLKASVEQAYKGCGWSLNSSTCTGPMRKFPTFRDVMKALPTVVDSKGFSNDTQGDYKGALLTRLESLTNGINGQVLCAYDELPDSELFDKNVIVDLSRVGSSETKALLMGVLILKLQEHRMEQRADGTNKPNSGLRHITVLEEAHNLLRRTSMEQSQESSNLQGKSVEMLTNAIAEMRTYGEGFIIADQSPGLLDMAVIRNTNTKIVLRLPDESDRMLVGKAAGLNDEQIVELSRLDTGVAAVYQNHWLEPVLCKVDYFGEARCFSYQPTLACKNQLAESVCQVLLQNAPDGTLLEREGVDHIRTWIDRRETGREIKKLLCHAIIDQKPLSTAEQRYVLYCLVHGKRLVEEIRRDTVSVEEARTLADRKITESLLVSEHTAQEIRQIILSYAAKEVQTDRKQYQELMEIRGVK